MIELEQSRPPEKQLSAWTMFLPNGTGRTLLGVMLPLQNEIIALENSTIARVRVLQAALALRQYYNANHTMPASYANLISANHPAAPVDPFDGQPLRYDAAKGIVYSVGTLLKDNGGSKFLKMRKDDPDYEDPMDDKEQPTLQLTFQNAPKGAAAR